MTGKRRFAQYSLFVCGLAATLGCGSSQKTITESLAKEGRVDASPSPVASSVVPTVARVQSDGIIAELSSSEVHDGSIAIVTLKLPPSLEGQPIQGEFEGIHLPFFKNEQSYQAVLGVPYDRKPGLASVHILVGKGESARRLDVSFTVLATDYASETIRVQASKVQPQDPKALARIKLEQAEVGQLYTTVTPRKYWSGVFALPLQAAFTSRYGTRRVYNGLQKSAHLGLDFKATIGTPIYSPAPGKVVLAKDLFFTGNTVIIDHGYGVLTVYAHLSKFKVKKNTEVKIGEVLGLAGKTGRVTGPHLHWMAVVHKQKVNPFGLTQVMK